MSPNTAPEKAKSQTECLFDSLSFKACRICTRFKFWKKQNVKIGFRLIVITQLRGAINTTPKSTDAAGDEVQRTYHFDLMHIFKSYYTIPYDFSQILRPSNWCLFRHFSPIVSAILEHPIFECRIRFEGAEKASLKRRRL